jgi:hypothetical protein
MDTLELEFDSYRSQFLDSAQDIDADGLPEEFALALVSAACSLLDGNSLRDATMNAFDINLATLSGEDDFVQVESFQNAIAALLLISQDTQNAVKLILLDSGIALGSDYEAVMGSVGIFMPSAVSGLSLAQGYEVFDDSQKAVDEPYSATGDFDGDGASNLTEYNAVVIDGGGSVEDFVAAAGDPLVIGGEGEGPPPICGALWIDGAPISGGVGDMALLALVVGAMLFHRRRKTKPAQWRSSV